MPKSARLQSIEAGKKKKATAHAERNRQEQRREPRKCTECSRRAARHGCRFCQRCHEELRPSKKELLLLCQGCPGLAQVQRRIERIVWAADAPDIAEWIEKNLELDISQPSKNITARWIQIQGWKGASDFDELRPLNGSSRDDISYIRLIERNFYTEWHVCP
jgi:hypothetical protein